MSDSFGDGWNGNILGIKQNNTIIGTFGSGFVTGFSSGPVYVNVQANVLAQIVVVVLGSWTKEIGFNVKVVENGSTIFSRSSGQS